MKSSASMPDFNADGLDDDVDVGDDDVAQLVRDESDGGGPSSSGGGKWKKFAKDIGGKQNEKKMKGDRREKGNKGCSKFNVRRNYGYSGMRWKNHDGDAEVKEMWDTIAGGDCEDDRDGGKTLDDDNFIDDSDLDPADRFGSDNEPRSPSNAPQVEVGDEDEELKQLFKMGKKRKINEKSAAEIALLVENAMAELEVVAEDDAELNRKSKLAINKLKKLPLLTEVLSKKQLQQEFLDHGVLTLLKNWLEPLPDGSLPNINIREAILQILTDYPIDLEQYDRREQLKKSGLGKEEEDEEAVRLKTLAEEKYTTNLKSALKYAKRAYCLNPNLDGLSGMLTAFRILSASSELSPTSSDTSASIIGSSSVVTATAKDDSFDWYKILQIEPFSHINTIKKQYKSLALLLHPDKNRFTGAEEAFKLVAEAFRVLSDKIRRKKYDMKLRIAMQSAATEAMSVELVETFWTACTTCRLLHKFQKKYMGHNLMCPNCKKSFKAVEVSENMENSEALESKVQEDDMQTRGSDRITGRSVIGKRKMSSVGELLRRSKAAKVELPESVDDDGSLCTTSAGFTREFRSKRAEELISLRANANSNGGDIDGLRSRRGQKSRIVEKNDLKSGGIEASGRSKGEEDETMTLAEIQLLVKRKINKEKIKSRLDDKEKNMEEEDNEKNLDKTEMETNMNEEMEENMENSRDEEEIGNDQDEEMNGDKEETGNNSDEDIEDKRDEEAEKNMDKEEVKKDLTVEEIGDMEREEMEEAKDENHKEGKDTNPEIEKNREEGKGMRKKRAILRFEDMEFEKGRRLKSRNLKTDKQKGPRTVDQELSVVEDTHFYDFDKDRVEKKFKIGQVWAIYDDEDKMPRHYGIIDEVVSLNPFEVRLSWLDLENDSDEGLTCWGRLGFYISCGRFKVSGKTLVKSLSTFSHVVDCERAALERYLIYPKKGSIWALYSENVLDVGRSTAVLDKICYDIVVFLNSYSELHGSSLAYLEKVDGFKTVFTRKEIGCQAVRWLEKIDARLFSHQIHARKLCGNEASGLPTNCWELDPTSLPPKLLAGGMR